MKLKSRNNGISLISLIITIIVIIILAAVVIFSGMDTPEKAQLSKVISDIDNVQTAVDQAYYGLYTEKAVAGEVWTQSQFYEAVATGETDRNKLSGDGLIEIGENSLVDINLPVYEGRKWYVAVSDMSDTVKVGSAVLSPGFESQGKTYATLLDIQNGGSDGTGSNGSNQGEYAVVEPENVDDWIYSVQEDNTVVINRYKGSATEVVVPNHIDGMPVVALDAGGNMYAAISMWDESICNGKSFASDGAFKSQITISKVIVSEGIKFLGKGTFVESHNLQEVILPSSLIDMGEQTFANCNSLKSIIIPNNVTSIGNSVFTCSGLINIAIPSSVMSIEKYAFYNCDSLTNVTMPDSVINIEDYAFTGCVSLTNITIPNSVTEIGNYIFWYCRSLTSITIPNNVKSIGTYAFCWCDGLTSVTIPSSVISIGSYAFNTCKSLTNIEIPSSVTIIKSSAFKNISSSAQIKCQATSKPSGWDENWTNCSNVVWNADLSS